MATAIDIVTVKPIAICQSDACDTLPIADANTGKGIYWRIDPECGNLDHDAEKIEGAYGGDEEEREAAANNRLPTTGLSCGEEAGDRYELVEV